MNETVCPQCGERHHPNYQRNTCSRCDGELAESRGSVDSLIAAIEGDYSKMSHADLVLTCQILERGRAAWRKEAEAAQKNSERLNTVPLNFRKEIADLINRNSMENGSDTPDFILGEYLASCLEAFNAATRRREHWYRKEPGNPPHESDGMNAAPQTEPTKL